MIALKTAGQHLRSKIGGQDLSRNCTAPLPAQFLSPDINTRTDNWGGDLTNRTRFIREILEQIRSATRTDFQLGLRLSPERFGLRMAEILELAQTIMASGVIDWLDMSLWDVFKLPEEIEFADKPLLSWFAELDHRQTRLGAAGNILSRGAALWTCRGFVPLL